MTEQMADNLEEVIGRTFLAERFLMKGRQEGIQEGRQKGRQEGIQEGRRKGIQEGRQKGRQEGRAEGRAEGAEKLLKLLKEGLSPEEALEKVLSSN